LKDVPEVKIAAAAKASQFIVDIVQQSDVGFFVLTVPTAADAEENGLDLATYEQMQWAAMSADYAKISEQGQKLKQLLAQSRSVRITSPAGTDVTLSVGDRPIFVSDAVITPEESRSRQFMTRTASLPGGGVFFAPIEETVSGHVVVPKLRVFEKSFANIRCDFRNGTIADFQADEGRQYFDEIMAAHDGAKDIVSVVSIGLNPALHVIEEGRANYRPAEAAGMVWISTGANDLLGGRNVATGGFGFPITNATVTVDGKVVVKDGTLQP
jgi:leucyl aminopeptidase (aminopeptidase T)